MVAYARNAAEKASLTNQLSFRLGDMKALPFKDDTFDWVWSMDCVGYAPIEPLPLIKELVRVTKPGGSIALLAWSSQHILPGYPALEAQLNATPALIPDSPLMNLLWVDVILLRLKQQMLFPRKTSTNTTLCFSIRTSALERAI